MHICCDRANKLTFFLQDAVSHQRYRLVDVVHPVRIRLVVIDLRPPSSLSLEQGPARGVPWGRGGGRWLPPLLIEEAGIHNIIS